MIIVSERAIGILYNALRWVGGLQFLTFAILGYCLLGYIGREVRKKSLKFALHNIWTIPKRKQSIISWGGNTALHRQQLSAIHWHGREYLKNTVSNTGSNIIIELSHDESNWPTGYVEQTSLLRRLAKNTFAESAVSAWVGLRMTRPTYNRMSRPTDG